MRRGVDRYRGALLGLAVGDALGRARRVGGDKVEVMPDDEIEIPVIAILEQDVRVRRQLTPLFPGASGLRQVFVDRHVHAGEGPEGVLAVLGARHADE